MGESYFYIKALHIASVVCWFAGLFYIVRLFIYHVEANEKEEAEKKVLQDQFNIMMRRLWLGITVPAMVASTLLGAHLVVAMKSYTMPWFHIKATSLVMLLIYHFQCGKIRKQLVAGVCRWTSKQLRIFNEVATVLLFAIIFPAVTKSPTMTLKGMVGFFVVAFVLVLVFRKRLAGKVQNDSAGS